MRTSNASMHLDAQLAEAGLEETNEASSKLSRHHLQKVVGGMSSINPIRAAGWTSSSLKSSMPRPKATMGR